MPSAKKGSSRFRITVPNADVTVLKWMEEQVNPSFSIRQLIKNDVAQNGCNDVTCRDILQEAKRGPGRPSNAEVEARRMAEVMMRQKLESQEATRPVVRQKTEPVTEESKPEPKPVKEKKAAVKPIEPEPSAPEPRVVVNIGEPDPYAPSPGNHAVIDEDGFADPEKLLGF